MYNGLKLLISGQRSLSVQMTILAASLHLPWQFKLLCIVEAAWTVRKEALREALRTVLASASLPVHTWLDYRVFVYVLKTCLYTQTRMEILTGMFLAILLLQYSVRGYVPGEIASPLVPCPPHTISRSSAGPSYFHSWACIVLIRQCKLLRSWILVCKSIASTRLSQMSKAAVSDAPTKAPFCIPDSKVDEPRLIRASSSTHQPYIYRCPGCHPAIYCSCGKVLEHLHSFPPQHLD